MYSNEHFFIVLTKNGCNYVWLLVFVFKLIILIFRDIHVSWILHLCTTPINEIFKRISLNKIKWLISWMLIKYLSRDFLYPDWSSSVTPSPNSNTQLLASCIFYLLTCNQALIILYIVSIGNIIYPRKGATTNRHQPLSSIDPPIHRR